MTKMEWTLASSYPILRRSIFKDASVGDVKLFYPPDDGRYYVGYGRVMDKEFHVTFQTDFGQVFTPSHYIDLPSRPDGTPSNRIAISGPDLPQPFVPF